MKRFLTILLTLLALTAALCVSASASDFNQAAESLREIGVFRGDGTDLRLDRAPTRAEAAIMLVRLCGGEREALEQYESGEISHPFTDVGSTAAPYIAWLWEKGIANGISDTSFGGSRSCSARSCVVFLLRALGYQDGEDFTYDQALSFAAEKGLYDAAAFPGPFLRDDLAAVTCQALACDLKDGGACLLDSLIRSGAVDEKAAEDLTARIRAYRALLEASEKLGNAADVQLETNLTLTVSAGGLRQTLPVQYTGRMQTVLGENPQMALSLTGSAAGEPAELGMWLRDGWLYTRQGDAAGKVDTREQEDAAAYLQTLEGSRDMVMLPFLESILAERSGSDTVYTLQLNRAALDLMSDPLTAALGTPLLPEEGSPLAELDFSGGLKSCTYTYTVSGGKLKQAGAQCTMEAQSRPVGVVQNQVTARVGLTMETTMTVQASGSGVKVAYPADLDQFPTEIGGEENAAVPALLGKPS